jgi:hypothetical protein
MLILKKYQMQSQILKKKWKYDSWSSMVTNEAAII